MALSAPRSHTTVFSGNNVVVVVVVVVIVGGVIGGTYVPIGQL